MPAGVDLQSGLKHRFAELGMLGEGQRQVVTASPGNEEAFGGSVKPVSDDVRECQDFCV